MRTGIQSRRLACFGEGPIELSDLKETYAEVGMSDEIVRETLQEFRKNRNLLLFLAGDDVVVKAFRLDASRVRQAIAQFVSLRDRGDAPVGVQRILGDAKNRKSLCETWIQAHRTLVIGDSSTKIGSEMPLVAFEEHLERIRRTTDRGIEGVIEPGDRSRRFTEFRTKLHRFEADRSHHLSSAGSLS